MLRVSVRRRATASTGYRLCLQQPGPDRLYVEGQRVLAPFRFLPLTTSEGPPSCGFPHPQTSQPLDCPPGGVSATMHRDRDAVDPWYPWHRKVSSVDSQYCSKTRGLRIHCPGVCSLCRWVSRRGFELTAPRHQPPRASLVRGGAEVHRNGPKGGLGLLPPQTRG